MDKKQIKKTENDFIFAKVLGEVRKNGLCYCPWFFKHLIQFILIRGAFRLCIWQKRLKVESYMRVSRLKLDLVELSFKLGILAFEFWEFSQLTHKILQCIVQISNICHVSFSEIYSFTKNYFKNVLNIVSVKFHLNKI